MPGVSFTRAARRLDAHLAPFSMTGIDDNIG